MNGIIITVACALVLLLGSLQAEGAEPVTETPRQGLPVDFSHGPLKVSENQRYLIHEDGTPFFYQGDTAWELFHRLNREEAAQYLENRRAKGFSVIQAVALAELDGLNTPNAYGDRPLIDNDPDQPNEAYFRHVDFIVEKAREKGMYIGLLPTWGDKVRLEWGVGPVIFTGENIASARSYGHFLGKRYKDQPNIIWILMGDRKADGQEAIWEAMAAGLQEGDGGSHLITCHPQGGLSSSKWFHKKDWLDFNMLQSSHGALDMPNYRAVGADYALTPVKPCMDGEPRYEDHPVNWKPELGWFDDFDVRQAAYWGLFAGGFGHTYGCHDIWQMRTPKHTPISSARTNWQDALDFPGAWDMLHVRNLMLSRPMLSRIPDQLLIASGQAEGARHLQATRGEDYAFISTPYGTAFAVRAGFLSGEKLVAWWFDPRSGEAEPIGDFANKGTLSFDPPGEAKRGNDWVLVLDDAARRYPKPGMSN
jgi:hypothetical protein